MNWEHLKAFVWLRWRLLVNQWRKAGALNAVLMMIVVVGAVVTAVPIFVGCFALATYLIPEASPNRLMYAWDGIVLSFLMFWGIGLLTELQRSDSLALSKFLHLPVSPNAAFLINYASSLLRLSLIVFVPIMLGFALAIVYVKGLGQVVDLVLLAAFLLMVTALTYQFQGWLGALVSDPRRRRTVVVVATLAFILFFQLPNLVHAFAPWQTQMQARSRRIAAQQQELARLIQQFNAQQINYAELKRRQQELTEQDKRITDEENRVGIERLEWIGWIANAVLPFGWLPLGVRSAADGRALPAVLSLLGMTLIGTLSLRAAYRTTVGQYMGRTSPPRKPAPLPEIAAVAAARRPVSLFVESQVPGLSEPVSAVALAALRGLVRAPEAKMMLLTPIIMAVVFGSMLVRTGASVPEWARVLIALGAMAFVLLGTVQAMGNQFGFDRDGFRVYVLCAARRRDILFGKNLAFAPVAIGMGVALLALLQAIAPLRLDHLVAVLPLYVSMYLLYCLLMNLVSIYTPYYIPPGSFQAQPKDMKLTTVLLQLVMIFVFFPLTQAPGFLPSAIEAIARLLGVSSAIPVFLLASFVELAVVVLIYGLVIDWEGRALQTREQVILDRVTNRNSAKSSWLLSP